MSMMESPREVTTTQILVPLVLISFTVALLFAFQLTQIMRDRETLHAVIAQQEEPLRKAEQLNNQFGGLVMGTRQLAVKGNKKAAELVEQLKQVGVVPAQEPEASVAPVPAASAPSALGPVKP